MPLLCMNAATGNPFSVNPPQAYPIDNEFCYGTAMLLVRPKSQQDSPSAFAYFQSRKRQFELQFQLRFRKEPTGNLWYGVHLNHDPDLGTARRLFVQAVFAFIQTRHRNSFHFALRGKTRAEGHEKAHMSFDLERSGFNVVVTPPGQTPPPLGQDIPIDECTKEKMKRRQPIHWNTEDTYTISCFNMHADFAKWAFVRLPGLSDRDISSIVGPFPLGLRVYATPTHHPHHHCQTQLQTLLDLELSHTSKTTLGPHAEQWKQQPSKPKEEKEGVNQH